MSLTGASLLVTVVVGALCVIAATVLGWRRGGRARRRLTRIVGVLTSETLVLLTVGLVVNRAQEFYPSWAALLHPGTSHRVIVAVRAGGLDGWLRDHFGAADPAVFTWRPAGWPGWGLAGPPTLVVPDDYLRHPTLTYPAVLLLSDAASGWTEAAETRAAAAVDGRAGPVVVVLARPDPGAVPTALADSVPADLNRDLRTSGHGWAVVSATGTQGLARRVMIAAPGRYAALAVVQAGPAGAARRSSAAPRSAGPDRSGASGRRGAAGRGSPSPSASRRPITSVAGPALPPGVPVVTVQGAGTAAMERALLWAARQTPPPMATPAPLVPPSSTWSPSTHRHDPHRKVKPVPKRPTPSVPATAVAVTAARVRSTDGASHAT